MLRFPPKSLTCENGVCASLTPTPGLRLRRVSLCQSATGTAAAEAQEVQDHKGLRQLSCLRATAGQKGPPRKSERGEKAHSTPLSRFSGDARLKISRPWPEQSLQAQGWWPFARSLRTGVPLP